MNQYYPAPGVPLNSTRTNSGAVVSLIFGILGFTFLPVLGSVVAVIAGHVARGAIRRDPTQAGDGLAVAGLVMGWIVLGLVALFGGMLVLFMLSAFLSTS